MPEPKRPPESKEPAKPRQTRAQRRQAAKRAQADREPAKKPALPAGAPSPEAITAFTTRLEDKVKEALAHPEFILGLEKPEIRRKTLYVYEAPVEDLLGELLERLEAQEFMLVTIGREKSRKGRVTTNLSFDLTNWAPASRAPRLKKAAGLAEQQYLQSNDI